MKKYLIAPFLALFLLMGCATPGTSPLEAISQEMDKHVEVLSRDWLRASACLHAIGVNNLPKNIVDQIEEIDEWWKDDNGDWIEADQINLNTWQKWYIASVRVGHAGAVLQAIVKQHAPGILNFPEVISSLAFLGLAL